MRAFALPSDSGWGYQALIVSSRQAKGVALVLSAAVAMTLRTSAASRAADIPRQPFVILRWTTAGRRSRSQRCSSPRPLQGGHEGQVSVAPALHVGLERRGRIASRGTFQDGVEALLQFAPLARQGRPDRERAYPPASKGG